LPITQLPISAVERSEGMQLIDDVVTVVRDAAKVVVAKAVLADVTREVVVVVAVADQELLLVAEGGRCWRGHLSRNQMVLFREFNFDGYVYLNGVLKHFGPAGSCRLFCWGFGWFSYYKLFLDACE
jgi:hypothetical protein